MKMGVMVIICLRFHSISTGLVDSHVSSPWNL